MWDRIKLLVAAILRRVADRLDPSGATAEGGGGPGEEDK